MRRYREDKAEENEEILTIDLLAGLVVEKMHFDMSDKSALSCIENYCISFINRSYVYNAFHGS